uniref:Ubiquitin carboxyl-terminal hydrolase MINDY n=1 Tax=Nothobranchius korthausae TaxID=1143690 RepID=A0A1A8F2D4_9TELE
MLKTPRFPVWVCCINGTYSVLFSLNRSLLSDWRMEHQFQLFYYNGQNSHKTTTRLTVDTHSHHWEAPSPDPGGDLEKRFPSLEMIIRTKWAGAVINWNGTDPFY